MTSFFVHVSVQKLDKFWLDLPNVLSNFDFCNFKSAEVSCKSSAKDDKVRTFQVNHNRTLFPSLTFLTVFLCTMLSRLLRGELRTLSEQTGQSRLLKMRVFAPALHKTEETEEKGGKNFVLICHLAARLA